jgi:hypothetical protein
MTEPLKTITVIVDRIVLVDILKTAAANENLTPAESIDVSWPSVSEAPRHHDPLGVPGRHPRQAAHRRPLGAGREDLARHLYLLQLRQAATTGRRRRGECQVNLCYDAH